MVKEIIKLFLEIELVLNDKEVKWVFVRVFKQNREDLKCQACELESEMVQTLCEEGKDLGIYQVREKCLCAAVFGECNQQTEVFGREFLVGEQGWTFNQELVDQQ